jgi:hypothetical protein
VWYDVHRINVHQPDAAVYDSEGRRTQTVSTVVVQGRITGGSASERDEFAQKGITLDAVALVPLDTVVDYQYLVTCDDSTPITALQDLVYRVVGIRPNLSHNRLMLQRTPPRG